MSAPTFADSSAVVKLYADEYGADRVQRAALLVVSQLARVEVPAALWKKHRTGDLQAASVAILVAEFEADYFGTDDALPRFVIVAVSAAILENAARLVGAHGLRAYDAVQLATAKAAHAAADGDFTFLAFDDSLCTAAAAEGLALMP
jgi:hypothetical protein